MSELESSALDAALTRFVEEVTRLKGAKLAALIRRLGCDGKSPSTLEKAASIIGVTRERMRQMQKRFSERLPKHPVFMPQLDAAINAVREAAPIAVDRAADLLHAKGITTCPFHPQSLRAAAEYCGRVVPFEIDSTARAPRIILEHRKDVERMLLSVASRQAGASGATNVQEVIAEATSRNAAKLSEEEVRRFLKDYSQIEFLNGDWFWHKDGPRNRLCNLTRKMLSVASPMQVTELREGVQRHYRIRATRPWPLITPPRAVMEAFYRAHPEFAMDSAGQISCVFPLDFRIELNPTERILLEVLRSSPACLLDYQSVVRACMDRGMNPNTCSQYLSSSPVIARLGTGLWSLRGVKVDPASVEALRQANAEKPREKRILDYGWTESGDLWFAARLPALHSSLVLGVPSAIRRFVADREFQATDEHGLPAGILHLNADGTASYGYGQFLTRYGADQGDLLMILFHLTEGRATFRLITDEELDVISPSN